VLICVSTRRMSLVKEIALLPDCCLKLVPFSTELS
jgi:hypothetical protein